MLDIKIKNKYLDLVLKRQIMIGVESIYASIFASIHHERISIYHILNELLSIIQIPICLVIIEKDTNRFISFNKFKLDQEQIKDKIEKATCDELNYFDMWGTRYKLLALMARPNGETKEKNYSFDILIRLKEAKSKEAKSNLVFNYWDAASYKLQKILEIKRYGATDRKRFQSVINDSICKVFDAKVIDLNGSKKNNLLNSNVADKFIKSLTIDATDYNIKNNGLIDKLYKKVSANYREITGISKGNRGKICNFLLFSRCYTEFSKNDDYIRHNEYRHRTRLLLCDSQKEELENYFNWLLEDDNYERIVTNIFKSIADCDEEWRNIFFQIESEFKSVLLSHGGVSNVIKIIESPTSSDARSIADSVFDGLSVYRTPFAVDAGIRRYYPWKDRNNTLGIYNSVDIDILKDLNGEKRNDLLGLVAIQFLFDAMSDDATNDDNSTVQVMLSPVEVGGRLWGVTCYITKIPNLEKTNLELEAEVDSFNRLWLQNYHIHHHVNQRMLRSLRSYMNKLYETMIADVYLNWYDGLAFNQSPMDVKGAEAILNAMLFELTSLFPYNALSATIKKLEPDEISAPNKDYPNMAFIGTKYGALVQVSGRSMFATLDGVDAASLRSHVDEVDVAICITEKFMLKVLTSFAKVKSSNFSDATGQLQ